MRVRQSKKILSTVFPNLFIYTLCFPSGSVGKESPAKPETQETQVLFLDLSVYLNRPWLLLAAPAPLKGLHDLHHHGKTPCSFSFDPLVPNSILGFRTPLAEPKVHAFTLAARSTKKGNLPPSFIIRLNEMIYLKLLKYCLAWG